MEDYKNYFSYDPESGFVTWRVNFGRKIRAGVRAGSVKGGRYRRVALQGKTMPEHRLCFFLHTGRMPKGFIDHLNGNGLDNRWCNLRECTAFQNRQNIKAIRKSVNKTSKYTGVSWQASSGSWKASIGINRTKIHLGYFIHEDDAFQAYLKAKAELHKFNPIPRDME